MLFSISELLLLVLLFLVVAVVVVVEVVRVGGIVVDVGRSPSSHPSWK